MQRWTNQHEPEPPAASGKFLSADEVVSMVNLLRELRDLTLSRRTFATASELIARFTGETYAPSLVRADGLDG